MKIKLYEAGYCTHPEYIITKKFSFKKRKFPMICPLIHHEKFGYILFDAGYNEKFFESTKKFPYSLYKKITPVHVEKSLKELLIHDQISPKEIKFIIISHFHADHISGINDFPDATIICSKKAYLYTKEKKFRLHKGILPNLISAFENRKIIFFEDMTKYFDKNSEIQFYNTFDLFGDQSIIAYDLPGHAIGHYGIFCKNSNHNENDIFFISDAVWTIETLENHHNPHWLSYFLLENKKDYFLTIEKLKKFKKLNPNVLIIPSHCSSTYKKWLCL